MRSLALIVVCLLASCAYVEATTVAYVGVSRSAPVEPSKVQVLAAEPKQRHERLGEVILHTSSDPAPTLADIEDRLCEEAAKWGASAVYIVRDIMVPGNERQIVGI